MLNVSFKIFTKVAVNRLMSVADKIIRPTQSAFMPEDTFLREWWSFTKHYTNSNEKNLMELSSNLTLKRHIIKSSGIFSGKPYG